MFRSLAALVLLAGLLGCAPAEGQALFQEGTHYTRLRQVQESPKDHVEVLEIFAYGCVHCYHLAPSLAAWEASPGRSPQAKLRYLHVAWPQWLQFARAFYAAEAMGELGKLHQPLFRALFIENKNLRTVEEVADFAASLGIDRARFFATMHSFGVNTRLKQAESAIGRYEVMGTPTLVVAGKYKLEFGRGLSMEQVGPVIDFLVAKELAERKSTKAAG